MNTQIAPKDALLQPSEVEMSDLNAAKGENTDNEELKQS